MWKGSRLEPTVRHYWIRRKVYRRKPVTIYNARNGFHVIVNLDDFNLAERATANSQQLPTAFRGIIILYAAANSRGSHARQREANAYETA